MQSLPYEILQLIASSLLPRYQCRLALASRFCYQYLYNDMLRWHARKDAIAVPRHKIYKHGNKHMSMLVAYDKPHVMLLTDYFGNLFIDNITNMYANTIKLDTTMTGSIRCRTYVMVGGELWNSFKMYREFKIFAGYHKYLHKIALLLYINTQQPIFSLNWKLLNHINNNLSPKNDHILLHSGVLRI